MLLQVELLLLVLLQGILLRELCPVIVHGGRVQVGGIDVVETGRRLGANHSTHGAADQRGRV